MELEPCFYCGEDIDPDSTYESEVGYVLHIKCHAQFEKDNIEAERKQAAANLAENKRNKRIVKHLEKTLKPKLWKCIEWELGEHRHGELAIVTLDKVTGSKQSGTSYFGQSVAMRHIYDDTSSCSYSDTYGGVIFMYIGKGRYLQIHIWG